MKKWLVLDCPYLCHRAFHTMSDLSWKERPTGVIYGFLNCLGHLKDEFLTERIVFCFDHPYLHRRKVFPGYKKKRHSKPISDEELEAKTSLKIQMSELRKRYLPKIGFRNVFCTRGFESDDIMASIAKHCQDSIVLVTEDADLYQCLRPNVSIYSPRKKLTMTYDRFKSQYGILPPEWATIKAMAGCPGDEIPGIRGVGEKTALRFWKGERKRIQNISRKIQNSMDLINRNMSLVQLPFEGCPQYPLRKDHISKEGWLEVCDELGMRSLKANPPISTRRRAYA